MTTLASDWPTHFRFLHCNHLTHFDKTHKKQLLNELFSVFRAGGSPNMVTFISLWIPETFSIYHLQSLNRFWRNWKKKASTCTKFVFFRLFRQQTGPFCLWFCDIFDFYTVTTERISMKHHKKQILDVIHQVSVFRADVLPNMVYWPLIGRESGGGRVVKLLANGSRGPGFDSWSRHLNFRDWLSPASKSRYGWNTA